MFVVKCKTVPEAPPCDVRRSTLWCGWILGIVAGCAAPGKSLMESPLSIDEQQQAVLEIAPRGTFRTDVERRLKAAGIEFRSSGNGSIFYLALWNRPNGERWHINVALLFDSAGNLYQTRTADSSMSLGAGNELADPQPPAGGAKAQAPRPIVPAGGPDDGRERVAFPGQNDAPRQGVR